MTPDPVTHEWRDHDGRVLHAGTREACEAAKARYEAECREQGRVSAVTEIVEVAS